MRYLIFLLIYSFVFSAELIIQYPNLKKEYYKNQIINLKIKVITPEEMNLTFAPPPNTEINVSQENPFIYNISIKYKNTLEPKTLLVLSQKFSKSIVLNNLYKTFEIDKINGFCNVLSKNLRVDNVIASKYNDKYNIISFTIIGDEANLEDFNLNLKDENLTIISPQKATFLALTDKNIKRLKFYYFNTNIDNYEPINIPIIIKEETISTQTNLNPEDNTLFSPTNILILSIIAFLIIIFLIYQTIWLILPPILLSAFLIYINLPKGEAYLVRGTKIYILPTKNSTVFYKAPIGTKVKILKKIKNYTKIKIQNKIGWVKNEDIK